MPAVTASAGDAAGPARGAFMAQVRAILKTQRPGSADRLERFAALWESGLADADLLPQTPEGVAASVLSLWDHAQQRLPGVPAVRVIAPHQQMHADRSSFAVAEIVTDDMRFLVDSVLGALRRMDLSIQTLVHPVIGVRRAEDGQLQALDPAGAAESMMQICFGPGVPPEKFATVADELSRVLDDVRVVIADFPAMATRLEQAEAILPHDGAESAFLGWMRDGNFVLTGYRHYALTDDGIEIATDTALGVLRDAAIPVFDVLRDPASLSGAVLTGLHNAAQRVLVAKANLRSTVHRPHHCDVVLVKTLDAQGRVNGGHLFLGLFAATAYNRNPRSVPILKEKIARIHALARLTPDSHDSRALGNILETWPRDELFQADDVQILEAARGVLSLQIRPRLALFVRPDPFGRFVSVLTYIPRNRFDTVLENRLGQMVADAYEGRLSVSYVTIGDNPLARAHFVVATTPDKRPDVDVAALERAMAQAARSFADHLSDVAVENLGEERAQDVVTRWAEAFPASYTERHNAAEALADIALLEQARREQTLCLTPGRRPGTGPQEFVLKLARIGKALALSDILPLIETLGVRVVEETAHALRPAGCAPMSMQYLDIESADGAPVDLELHGAALHATLMAIWSGRIEADGFNRLVLSAGINWREAWLLRAMFKWCRQTGFPFSQRAVEAALAAQPAAVRWLVDTFNARFAPDGARTDDAAGWKVLLDAIASPDEDRILRRLKAMLDGIVRTNFFQADGAKPYIALKIDCAKAGDMPAPRPMAEIWVHGARMEGCHLRGGKVARGGIRWSDRREDFRTEVLGLLKAQMLKNVIIVPVGAKGGFVLKKPPAVTGDAAKDREALQAEGIAAYRMLIGGMLDVTDNLAGQDVMRPAGVAARDGDDPYIVAAADKGTATFSNIANELSAEYGFWLGDAFASGGSKGYDHKGMGITARGAWVNIARHFREMDHDIQAREFTCVGVGDMSGDVFGNGLLVSRKTQLVAAFDHRHIFLDPAPDPAVSYDERARLFALGRSSWADYDAKLISAGGGVFARTAKTVPLSPQVRALLDLNAEAAEPDEVIRAILKARVDLLYFGGIGTYLKASTEGHGAAGDRANDAIRIDGREVRARVVGEGANLGVTQAARIEAAQNGVRINTDALDNSAGVSTSDHEVNIKILLADAMSSGLLDEEARVQLLRHMTDEVAQLVLRDNHQQSQAISLDALGGAANIPAYAALMNVLTAHGSFDRAVAGMPDDAALAVRAAAQQGLTRPECCTMLAQTKLWLADAIDRSRLPDDPLLQTELDAYFPAPLRARFPEQINRHRLRRELIGTAMTNELVNRMGAAAFGRLAGESGAAPVAVAKAAWVAREAFGLAAFHERVEALEDKVPAATLLAMQANARYLQEEAARGLLSGVELDMTLNEAVAALKPGLAALMTENAIRVAQDPQIQALTDQGVGQELAALAVALPRLASAPAIVRLAAQRSVKLEQAEAAWNKTGEIFGIEALRNAALAAPVRGGWGGRAVAALADDLTALRLSLSAALLEDGNERALMERLGPAAARAAQLARDAAAVPDFAACSVALRGLRRLMQSS